MIRGVLSCIVLLLLASPVRAGDRDAFAEGVRLLRAGQPGAAWDRLKEAEKSYAGDVPAGLLADLAVAGFQAGKRGEAESYAERAAAADGALTFLRDLIVGGARLHDGRAALQSRDPKALASAEKHAERAVHSFERAVAARPESPEARRNLERALQLMEEIEKRKQDEPKKEGGEEEQEKRGQERQENEEKENDGKKANDGQEKEKEATKNEEQKPGDKQRNEQDQNEQKRDDQKQDQQKQDQQGESRDGKDDEKRDQGASAKQGEAANEPPESRSLSNEEQQRLLQQLDKVMQQKVRLREDRRPRHVPGKRDW